MCPQKESNLHQRFRKPSLYPFNYEGMTLMRRRQDLNLQVLADAGFRNRCLTVRHTPPRVLSPGIEPVFLVPQTKVLSIKLRERSFLHYFISNSKGKLQNLVFYSHISISDKTNTGKILPKSFCFTSLFKISLVKLFNGHI